MLWWWLIYACICGLLLAGWYLIEDYNDRHNKAEKRAKAAREIEYLKKQPVEVTNITPEELLMLIELDNYHHEGDC